MAFSAALDDQFLIWHIFRVGADGSSLRDLSPQAAREEHAPKWHPTDDTILFSSHTSSDTSQLYVMKSDGSERRQLTAGEDLKDSASWSPTGEMVTYEVTTNLYEEDKTMYALYVINGDGTQNTLIHQARKWAVPGGWAPDGLHLGFSATESQVWDLSIVSICDGIVKRIVEDVTSKYAADWRPSAP